MRLFRLFLCFASFPVAVVVFCLPEKAVGDDNILSFALVGDIMLGTDYPDSLANIPTDNGFGLLRAPSDILSEADVAIGNLEGPFTVADSCIKVLEDSITYAFRMPPFLASRLAESGFDVLTTANNHANDFGIAGRVETETVLDSLGIAHTGRIGDIATVTVRGSTIAVVGFAPNRGCHSLLNISRASALVDSLDDTHDYVVVTYHGGREGIEFVHQPDGPECFLELNRGDLKRFSRAVIDAGADIVFGHGPHVPRGVELYRDRLIAYSLGNFCTWFGISVKDEKGLAPLLWVELDTDGTLHSFCIHSFEQQGTHYPRHDKRRRVEKLMISLSEEDFGSFPFNVYKPK